MKARVSIFTTHAVPSRRTLMFSRISPLEIAAPFQCLVETAGCGRPHGRLSAALASPTLILRDPNGTGRRDRREPPTASLRTSIRRRSGRQPGGNLKRPDRRRGMIRNRGGGNPHGLRRFDQLAVAVHSVGIHLRRRADRSVAENMPTSRGPQTGARSAVNAGDRHSAWLTSRSATPRLRATLRSAQARCTPGRDPATVPEPACRHRHHVARQFARLSAELFRPFASGCPSCCATRERIAEV